ncbi:electron transport complex subunit RsxG [Aromatoleum buckelii]|uniref:Ion-translocating oxidoreductase complex subunit G n=1 Tax=Aromatoleum buckelii TaxID=200254 RepID=A0ABX1N368_9RHOO|nr:electron transport complex subunit RsxG [Aromatoleum buckelii]MCK0513150.1 electron transport complex subunit RsxG [Aromatoleum buckelii]
MKPRTYVHALILGTFCLGFGFVLAVTDRVTTEPIADRALEDKLNSLAQVLPEGLHDNNPIEDAVTLPGPHDKEITVYRALRDGQVTGVAYEIRGSGYAGEIRLMLGVDANGQILGVRAIAHKETPGLGDKIEVKKGDWILHFAGRALGNPAADGWKVKKDGGSFDQFAGATITPRGVVAAVRGGLEFFATHKTRLMEVN